MKKNLHIANLLFKSHRWSVHNTKAFNTLNLNQNFIKKDYEYCTDIQTKLNDHKYLEAYNLLLESYFNNITLDAQIFYLVFKKSLDNKFDISYLQVLYKIYRHNFEPMHMMNQFMQILVNQKSCQQSLKKDFEYLHMKLPNRKKRLEKIKKKSQSQENNDHQENNKEKQRLLREFEQNNKSSSEQTKQLDLQKIIINSLKKTIGNLTDDYQIKFYDMKIQLNAAQRHEYNYQNTYSSEQDKQYHINKIFLLKKISIGKIEIQEKKYDPI